MDMVNMLTDEEKVQVNELLHDYLIVKEEDGTVCFYNRELFEEQTLWSTFDRYGQKVGHEDAGDNHPENGYSELGAMWSKLVTENVTNEDWDYDAELEKFIDEHEDEIELLTCIAHTFHNGNNWQTWILQSDNPNFHCSFDNILEGEEAEKYAAIVVMAENDNNFTRYQGYMHTSIVVSGVEYNVK